MLFVKEKETKRTRAERKAEEAQDMNKAKDKELDRLVMCMSGGDENDYLDYCIHFLNENKN